MLYKEASRIIQSIQDKKSTVKNLVLSSKFKNKKQLYALVCETLKYKEILTSIIETTQIQRREKILRQDSLALVLLYDFLIGKGLHGPDDKFKEAVLKHKAALQSELARIKVKVKASKNEDLLPTKLKDEVAIPRYVRVNTLKTTVADVIEHFRREDYSEITVQGLTYERYVSVLRGLKACQFFRDIHVPELLVFAAGTDLHDHILYRSGDIILQDKASCLPAFVLSPRSGCHVIDCCAAPGNKTSHIAAILGNKGKVFAFDKDLKRAATLNTQLLKAGVLCAEVKHADFLSVSPTDPKYQDVECVLVDPSCSGSGIVNRLNEVTSDQDSSNKSRLENLAKFQVTILTHAMTFPKVTKVVYSTCSIHQTENEMVVKEAIDIVDNKFEMVSVLKEIPSRGQKIPEYGDFVANKCVRLSPKNDLTNGFFIACLRRKSSVQNGSVARKSGKNMMNLEQNDKITNDVDTNGQKNMPDLQRKTGKKSQKHSQKSESDHELTSKKSKKRKNKGKISHQATKQGESNECTEIKHTKNKRKKLNGQSAENNVSKPTPTRVVFQASKSNQKKKRNRHKNRKPVTS